MASENYVATFMFLAWLFMENAGKYGKLFGKC